MRGFRKRPGGIITSYVMFSAKNLQPKSLDTDSAKPRIDTTIGQMELSLRLNFRVTRSSKGFNSFQVFRNPYVALLILHSIYSVRRR